MSPIRSRAQCSRLEALGICISGYLNEAKKRPCFLCAAYRVTEKNSSSSKKAYSGFKNIYSFT